MQGNLGYAILFGAWCIYFFIHSFLASEKFKDHVVEYWHVGRVGQRRFYSVVSILGLLALLFLNGATISKSLIPVTKELKIISMFLTASGVLVVRAGFKNYNFRQFLGIVKEESKMINKGILSKVRHPIYSGTILITIGFFLFDPRVSTLISSVSIFAYLPIGIILEERKLVDLYGKAYLNYKEKVPMLIPKFDLFKR